MDNVITILDETVGTTEEKYGFILLENTGCF